MKNCKQALTHISSISMMISSGRVPSLGFEYSVTNRWVSSVLLMVAAVMVIVLKTQFVITVITSIVAFVSVPGVEVVLTTSDLCRRWMTSI